MRHDTCSTTPTRRSQDLMSFVPGPDLPTGGTIVGLDGIEEAYASGRGAFKTRARVAVESISARKTGLVVTELPYLVGTERVIEKIKDGVNAKKLSGISDVTDLTDRTHGLRLVIGIKTGFSPTPCSSSSTASRRSRTPSRSTTSPSSTAARARSG